EQVLEKFAVAAGFRLRYRAAEQQQQRGHLCTAFQDLTVAVLWLFFSDETHEAQALGTGHHRCQVHGPLAHDPPGRERLRGMVAQPLPYLARQFTARPASGRRSGSTTNTGPPKTTPNSRTTSSTPSPPRTSWVSR